MVKYAFLLLLIAISTHAATFRDFTETRDLCYETVLSSCSFQPINKQAQPLSPEYLQCAQDYEKSNVCFYGYSQCYAKDTQTRNNDQMPLVCWNCYMESPSHSAQYKDFRECLATAFEPRVLLSLALVFIMLLVVL